MLLKNDTPAINTTWILAASKWNKNPAAPRWLILSAAKGDREKRLQQKHRVQNWWLVG